MTHLTIIIPHFNSPHYLERLLKSIPVRGDIQVIVIDDKSDKHLRELAALKANSSFAHVSFMDNATDVKSAGTCRNIGQKQAVGKWVMFADADDYFTDGFIEAVEKFFCEDYDVVFFVPTSFDADTNMKSWRHKRYAEIMIQYANEPNLQNELELRYFVVVPWSKMIRLDLIRKNSIEFDETIRANDIAHSVKIGHHMQKFCVSKDIIYTVTQHSKSLTKTYSEAFFDAQVAAFVWTHTFLKQNLSRDKFNKIDLKLRTMAIAKLADAVGYRLGMKKMLKTFFSFRNRGVKMLSVRFLPRLFSGGYRLVMKTCTTYRMSRD